jgi:hypothetical protein
LGVERVRVLEKITQNFRANPSFHLEFAVIRKVNAQLFVE